MFMIYICDHHTEVGRIPSAFQYNDRKHITYQHNAYHIQNEVSENI